MAKISFLLIGLILGMAAGYYSGKTKQELLTQNLAADVVAKEVVLLDKFPLKPECAAVTGSAHGDIPAEGAIIHWHYDSANSLLSRMVVTDRLESAVEEITLVCE